MAIEVNIEIPHRIKKLGFLSNILTISNLLLLLSIIFNFLIPIGFLPNGNKRLFALSIHYEFPFQQ